MVRKCGVRSWLDVALGTISMRQRELVLSFFVAGLGEAVFVPRLCRHAARRHKWSFLPAQELETNGFDSLHHFSPA